MPAYDFGISNVAARHFGGEANEALGAGEGLLFQKIVDLNHPGLCHRFGINCCQSFAGFSILPFEQVSGISK